MLMILIPAILLILFLCADFIAPILAFLLLSPIYLIAGLFEGLQRLKEEPLLAFTAGLVLLAAGGCFLLKQPALYDHILNIGF
ncbi:MAG: hypothetical protein HUJ80_08315 [Firmicutes bacterium]|nr:hypothetical protein [Bacillota bacterium]